MMRLCLPKTLILTLVVVHTLLGSVGAADEVELPPQDPQAVTFLQRALPWHPDAELKILEDSITLTPEGSYRFIKAERSCENKFFSGVRGMLIDQATGTAWIGNIAVLPQEYKAAGLSLTAFLDEFLPKAIETGMKMETTVEWTSDVAERGALIPFTLRLKSGWGEFRKPVAVTTDGRYLVLGDCSPYDQDPVAYRKELLRHDKRVVWDHGADGAKLEIVEFSDFQCPGCKAKWSLIRTAIETYGGDLHHGLVSYPITSIHPWAFRAACACWCIAQQNPTLVTPLKELFYSLQSDMTVLDVTPTAHDFAVGQGLDEQAFDACYLEDPSIDGVHEQIELANILGVNATPTYFINGWRVQMPDESWFNPMLERLVSGREP